MISIFLTFWVFLFVGKFCKIKKLLRLFFFFKVQNLSGYDLNNVHIIKFKMGDTWQTKVKSLGK